jgi:hypothetical protein
MAWVIAAASRARRCHDILPLSVPSKVHIADPNRAVQTANIPLQEMPQESELRNRLPQALSARIAADNEESPVDPGEILNPTSSKDTIHEKGT